MEEPKNWIKITNTEALKNFEKFEMNDETFSKIISQHNGSFFLTSFTKYNPKTHSGLIPTIKINVRKNDAPNFDDFKKMTIISSEGFKKIFKDFTFAKEPTEVEISGVKSMFFIGEFTMSTKSGQELKIRSRTYAIPYKNYFFQINFIDSQNGENCSSEFDKLVQTIKIGKKENATHKRAN